MNDFWRTKRTEGIDSGLFKARARITEYVGTECLYLTSKAVFSHERKADAN